MKESLQKDFIDEKGNEHTVIIEGEHKNILRNKNYKLQHEFENKKKKAAKGIFTSDIGVHSHGFAGIMSLALILAVATLTIAYLLLKF